MVWGEGSLPPHKGRTVKYTITPITPSTMADLAVPSQAHGKRLPGWHVTDLIRHAWAIAGNKVQEYGGDTLGLAAMGRLWEGMVRHYLLGLEEYEFVPDVQSERDGVVGNWDGYLVHKGTGRLIIQETKLKFSWPKAPADYPMEMHQVKAYCKMAGTLSVIMVVGALTSKPPQFTVEWREIEWTQEEVDSTWALLLGAKTYLEGKGIKPG